MFAGVLPTWLAEPGHRTIAYEKMWGDKVACIIISAELGFRRRLPSLFPILNARLSLAVIFSPSRFASALVAANYVSNVSTLHLRPHTPPPPPLLWLNVTWALFKEGRTCQHLVRSFPLPFRRCSFFFFFVPLPLPRCHSVSPLCVPYHNRGIK